MTMLRAHLETWRPYTLCYPGLVGLAGAALAAPDNSWWRLLGAWAVPTLGWLAGLYGGDYFDRKLDAVAKPHRPIPSGRLRPRTALACMIACVVAGAAIGLLLNWRTAILAAVALGAGIAYNTVFKARGLSGNVVRGGITALAFGFGALAAGPESPPVALLVAAAVFWLHDAGSNLVGTVRDVDGDRAGGYRTLPVRRGIETTLAVIAVLYASWVVAAAFAPLVLPVTPGVTAYAVLAGLAAAGGSAAIVLLIRAPRPIPRRLGLRAHEILVLERVVLAGAFVALGAGAVLAVPLTAVALAITWAAQRRMRAPYEFTPDDAPDDATEPAVGRDTILAYVDRQLAELPSSLSSLRRWDRRIAIEITDLALRIELVAASGRILRAPVADHVVTALPLVSISTTSEVFRDMFLLGRTTPRHAYLAGTVRMKAAPRDMIRLNQVFNEFRRRSRGTGQPDLEQQTVTDTTIERLPPQVVISDTTLRDGEQMPGIAFDVDTKVGLARRLDALGVPLIEVGFPAVSAEEQAAVRAITALGLGATIQVIARPVTSDIDAAVASGADSIALFAGTSDAHVRAKLRTTPERLLEQVREAVAYAKQSGRQIVFAAEDATRTDIAYLSEVFAAVAEAGADAVGIADTAGVATPWQVGRLVRAVGTRTGLPIAMHCHNDLGLATANSLAGLLAGASAVQCSVLGIGERAGNAPLEEVVLSLETAFGHKTGLDLTALTPLAHHVAALVGQDIAAGKPVVGGNAFTHESGLHVDGVVRDTDTYEPYPPELTGRTRRFVFGKHSGRTALRQVLSDHGCALGEPEFAALLTRVKRASATDETTVLEMARALKEER